MFAYYGLRGLSLIYLPFANFTFFGLSLFAVFNGLDWIATVPPPLAIANRAFGIRKAPVLFGCHQIGTAAATFPAGASRTAGGSCLDSLCYRRLCRGRGGGLSLMIGRKGPQPAAAAA